jgi:RNA polymerase sigma-70 factor (ECF subfamily)
MQQDGFNISAEQANEGLRNHDVDVFRQIYLAYSEELFLLASRWVKDEHLAKDLVHNLFVHLWEKGGSLTITGNVRHYLYRAITNRCLNELKRRSRFVSEDLLQWQADPSSLNEISDYILLQKELINHLQGLAPRCREIFMMSRVQGLDPSEIAAKLGITLNTVYFQLAVALKYLRTHMKEKKS